MTTVYSPAAILIITLSVLLILVILLTLASFCYYVATGRPLLRLGRGRHENPTVFALQELWRQSYWWVNANWNAMADMARAGAVKPVAQCQTAKSLDFLTWLRTTPEPKITAFVTLSEKDRHFAACFAAETAEGLAELTGVEKAGYTLPLLQRALTTKNYADVKTLVAALDAEALPAEIPVKALKTDVRRRFVARLAHRLRG